jgi:hypothetical protein
VHARTQKPLTTPLDNPPPASPLPPSDAVPPTVYPQSAAGRITSVEIPNDFIGGKTTIFRLLVYCLSCKQEKYPVFYTTKFTVRCSQGLPLAFVLQRMAVGYILTSQFFKIPLNTIVPSTLTSTKCVFHLDIPTKYCGIISYVTLTTFSAHLFHNTTECMFRHPRHWQLVIRTLQ